MNTKEVRSLCGEPRSVDSFVNDLWYNYGYVWLGFQDGILVVAIPVEKRTIKSISSYFNNGTNILER